MNKEDILFKIIKQYLDEVNKGYLKYPENSIAQPIRHKMIVERCIINAINLSVSETKNDKKMTPKEQASAYIEKRGWSVPDYILGEAIDITLKEQVKEIFKDMEHVDLSKSPIEVNKQISLIEEKYLPINNKKEGDEK